MTNMPERSRARHACHAHGPYRSNRNKPSMASLYHVQYRNTLPAKPHRGPAVHRMRA